MTDKRRRRFIEYARVSKVGERNRDELQSPDIQVSDMDRYAERNDIDVVDRVLDLDETGRSFERRAVKGIVARIERGEADGVLLYMWSRWGRNLLQSKIYIAAVEEAGGEVRASSEDFDPTTTIGRFTRDQMLLIAELLSNQISDGWKAVGRRRVERGMPHGGPPPFGYTTPERRGDPVAIHPVNGPIVEEMYARYLRGHGPEAIAKWLNNEVGVAPPRARSFGVSTVRKILDLGFAAGYIQVGGEQQKGAHEPIVDADTWAAYQRERDRRRRVHPKARQPRWYLGGGLTVCDRCGANMGVNSYVSPQSMAICSRYRGSRTCGGMWIKRVTLELIVDEWLGEHLREWADRRDELLGVDDERARLAKELDAARADQERLARGRRDALELVNRGLASIEDFQARAAAVDAERNEVVERSMNLQARLDALAPDADVLDRLERGLTGEFSHEEFHVLLRRLIRRVAVAKDTVTVEPWRGEPTVWNRR